MTSFYENLEEEYSLLNHDFEDEESKNFTINGKELNNVAKLFYEKSRILLYFTHLNSESMDFMKYNVFRAIIDELSYNIDNMATDYETLKGIIVHIELELGMSVLFTSALVNIVERGLNNIVCYEIVNNLTYGGLCEHYRQRDLEGFTKNLR